MSLRATIRYGMITCLLGGCLVFYGATCDTGPVDLAAGGSDLATVTGVDASEANQVVISGNASLEASPFIMSDPVRVGVDVKYAKASRDLAVQQSGMGLITKVEVQDLQNLDPPVVRIISYVTQDVSYVLDDRGSKLTLTVEPKRGSSAEAEETAFKTLPYDETKQELERMLSGAPPPPVSAAAAPMVEHRTTTASSSAMPPILHAMPPPRPDGTATVVGDIIYRSSEKGIQVMIMTNGPVGDFLDFDVLHPPRIVVDLWGLDAATPKKTYPVSWGGVSEVRIGQHADKTRVVINFTRGKLPAYDIRKTSTGVIVTILKKSAYIPGGISSQAYTTGSGDSFRSLAGKFYGNPNDWPRILAANRDVFTRAELETIRKDNGATTLGAGITIKVPVR